MRITFTTTALATLALCAALPLAGCGRVDPKTGNVTVGAAAAPAQPALPATTTGAPMVAAQPADPCPSIGTLAETRGGAIALNGARMVRMNTVCTPEQMTAHLRSYGEGARFILVADDLRAGIQPGALFELRFGPPTTGEAAVLGTLNFYAANRPGAYGQPHSISYDVTSQVASMGIAGWPAQGLGVAIAPASMVMPGSDASIGALRLVAQAPR